jgi:hypothetical protein
LLSFALVQKWPIWWSSPTFSFWLIFGASGMMAIQFSHQRRYCHHGLYHELQC